MDQTSHRLTDLSRRYLTGHPFDSSVELEQVLALIPRLSARALHARTAVLRLADEETGLHDQAYRFDSAEPETPPAVESVSGGVDPA